MGIILAFVFLVAMTILVDSAIRYRRTNFAIPAKLSDVQQAACARILDSGLGRPWVCRQALADGECACIPCNNLEKELSGELALSARLRA